MNNSTDCGCGKKELLLKSDYSTEEIDNFVKNITSQSSTGCGFTVKIEPSFDKKSKIEINVDCQEHVYTKDIKVSYDFRLLNSQPGGVPCSQTGCGGGGRCMRVSGKKAGKQYGVKKFLSIGLTNISLIHEKGTVTVNGNCEGCDTRNSRKICFGGQPSECGSSPCESQREKCSQALRDAEREAENLIDAKNAEHATKIENTRNQLTQEVQTAINAANASAQIRFWKKPSEEQIRNLVRFSWGGCSQGINIQWNGSNWQREYGQDRACENSSSINDQYKKSKEVQTTASFTKSGSGFSKCPDDQCQTNADCLSTSGSITAVVGISNILNEINKNGER